MKEQADWCMYHAQQALKDYDLPAAVNYIAMARMWINKN